MSLESKQINRHHKLSEGEEYSVQWNKIREFDDAYCDLSGQNRRIIRAWSMTYDIWPSPAQ
jgi:hypothetical protein